MFSLEGENSDEDLDFTPVAKTGPGLGGVFSTHQQSHTASSNTKLTYKPPKQPQQGRDESEPRNIEIKQTNEKSTEESFEPMSNIRPGVKMATAVSAYKFENNGFESLGKLGLAIIGKKESNCYQLLLYKGKQNPVAIANISPTLKLNIQPDNYANFLDERGSSFTVCFESQDVLINFAKQVLLCKTTFNMSGIFCCDLSLGEGKDVDIGDSLEVQMTSWTVENQSIGQMVETTRNKEKGLRFKLGGKNFFSGLEAGIVGMKKSGRRFLIAVTDNGMKAYDVEVTKLKSSEGERRTSLSSNNNIPDDKSDDLVERMARLGHPLIQNRNKNSIDMSQEMPELEEVHPKSAFSPISPPQIQRNDTENQNTQSESGFTTIPITNVRSDTPQSVKSGNSGAFGNMQQYGSEVQNGTFHSQGSEFNMLMSETRMQNTELRMNMQRVGDKVDTLLTLQGGGRRFSHDEPKVTTNDDIMKKLEGIMEQNSEMRDLLGKKKNGNSEGELVAEENFHKQQKLNEQSEMLKRLEQILREKEQQLGKVTKSQNESIKILEQKLEEQCQMTEKAQQVTRTQLNSEVKKVMNSTSKLLMSQFDSEESFTGQQVQETIGHTMRLVYEKVAEKYAIKEKVETRKEPPVAAVAPVPAEIEEWEAESDEDK
eukprot:GFUD01000448.1.p1 GENE.GFUD01000448.1~~GFUD01000448.1.p1  ORF type:complete len:654 (+),score=170.01 GFUD01000448.1:222-2183(+)